MVRLPCWTSYSIWLTHSLLDYMGDLFPSPAFLLGDDIRHHVLLVPLWSFVTREGSHINTVCATERNDPQEIED